MDWVRSNAFLEHILVDGGNRQQNRRFKTHAKPFRHNPLPTGLTGSLRIALLAFFFRIDLKPNTQRLAKRNQSRVTVTQQAVKNHRLGV